MKVDAWTLHNRKLEKIWRWTNERAPFKYHGQGQHSIKVGDIDGDGFDEILNGSIAIDNDGRTMWGTGMGHGDRFYLTDIDPARPGLEIWYTIEDPHPQNGVSLWDARTGKLIFGTPQPNDDNQIAGGLCGDIDPALPGRWNSGATSSSHRDGARIAGPVPPQNELVWWDADLLREIHTQGRHLEVEGRGDRPHGRQRPARRRHPRRLARGDRHVRERRAAHLQHDDSGRLIGASR